jgi:hypothetical protein
VLRRKPSCPGQESNPGSQMGRNKIEVQGGSNMTGTDLCVNKPHKSWSYLNHLVCGAGGSRVGNTAHVDRT